ncbi:MAG: DUF3486 family protein [Candidatus Hydrogenedens sp.]|nr:DUF3486 family protein [Candidatus Hydrogenedens sp.]
MARKSRSKVEALPGPVKRAVDELLASGRHTLDDILAHLKRLAGDGAVPEDELPSRTGLGRYAQKFEAVAKRMRMAQEVARTWQTDILKDPESDLGQALITMIETAAFEAAAQADGDTDVDKLELFGRIAKHLAQAKGAGTNRILALMKKAEEQQKKAVEAERRASAERAAVVGVEMGLSAERVAELQARVAGLRAPTGSHSSSRPNA